MFAGLAAARFGPPREVTITDLESHLDICRSNVLKNATEVPISVLLLTFVVCLQRRATKDDADIADPDEWNATCRPFGARLVSGSFYTDGAMDESLLTLTHEILFGLHGLSP